MKNKVGRPKNFKMTQESKDQISKSKTGYKMPQATKDKIQATLLDRNNEIIRMLRGNGFIDRRGYVLIYTGNSTYIREHRLVIEEIIDRPLKSNEVIHHLNMVKTDNNPKNLLLCSQSEHGKIHNWMRKNNIKAIDYGTENYKRLIDEVLHKKEEE